MKIKLLSAALGVALSAAAMSASAQKSYTEGCINISSQVNGMDITQKEYFRTDSNAVVMTMGPANVKVLTDANHKYLAILVDVQVASMKKAAIATPDEVDQAMTGMPTFTFAPSTETKQISGFNCKKVVATDAKANKTYDIWITNDITIPASAIPPYYATVGGVPIQYTAFQQGQSAPVTVTSITDEKAPKGTFGVPADYDKITLDDLKALGGNR